MSLSTALLLIICGLCAGQHGGKAEGRQVRFKPGTTSALFHDTVRDDHEVEYEIEARAGQDLIVRVVSDPGGSALIKVIGPAAKELRMSCLAAKRAEAIKLGLPTSAQCHEQSQQILRREGRTWSATLPETGNYLISVLRPDGLRGVSKYSLLITIPRSIKSMVLTPEEERSVEASMQKFIASFKNQNVPLFLSHFSRSSFFYATNPLNEMRIAVSYPELARDLSRKGEWYCSYLARCDGLDAFVDNIHDGEKWPRVEGARFVPPGQDASSPTFVTWRKEAGRWVIDEIGYPQA